MTIINDFGDSRTKLIYFTRKFVMKNTKTHVGTVPTRTAICDDPRFTSRAYITHGRRTTRLQAVQTCVCIINNIKIIHNKKNL